MQDFLIDDNAFGAMEIISQISTLKEEINQAKNIIAEWEPKRYVANNSTLNKGGMTIGEINERRRIRVLNNAYSTIEANEKALPELEVKLHNFLLYSTEAVGADGQPYTPIADPDWNPFSLFDS